MKVTTSMLNNFLFTFIGNPMNLMVLFFNLYYAPLQPRQTFTEYLEVTQPVTHEG